ncbi:hypothetical protein [Aquimarina sp. AU58]|uniref:hypothetical protein n=1 Tax=Aquimarina sp. AU58 TaxID=1874112 RepID=UPI000D6E5042|nr:hypothetical protein [Aquimarina sp. AU58]
MKKIIHFIKDVQEGLQLLRKKREEDIEMKALIGRAKAKLFSSVYQMRLKEAIDKEDYRTAAKIKLEIEKYKHES